MVPFHVLDTYQTKLLMCEPLLASSHLLTLEEVVVEFAEGLVFVLRWGWRGMDWISGNLALLIVVAVFLCLPLGLCLGHHQCLVINAGVCLEEFSELGMSVLTRADTGSVFDTAAKVSTPTPAISR